MIMKKLLLIAIICSSALAAAAQYPTTVSAANNCNVFRNFNNSDEGFSSPSIYSDGNDLSFFWNAGLGAEIESSGFNGQRSASLISPVYIQTDPGVVTVGFKYNVPNGTEYRIRVISSASSAPLEVIATTANGPVYTALPGTSGNVCVLLTDADLTVGRLIRFEFTFKTNTPGNMLFDDLAISVLGGPLPVTFEGVTSKINSNGSVKLLWNVGQEVNVKGYYLETSSNGTDFSNAGYVAAAGKNIYSMDYYGKMSPVTYFRVKNIDFDGKSKYSTIIRVYTKQTDLHLQVYPTPAKEQVTVEHSLALLNSMITLLRADGTILRKIYVDPGTVNTQLNVSTLAKGIYIIRFDNGAENSESVKFIKY
jgi:Secretion system C-terminal sorting domain